jgi:hypothetical protein
MAVPKKRRSYTMIRLRRAGRLKVKIFDWYRSTKLKGATERRFLKLTSPIRKKNNNI